MGVVYENAETQELKKGLTVGSKDGIVYIVVSGCGGIGRRTRLKILRW